MTARPAALCALALIALALRAAPASAQPATPIAITLIGPEARRHDVEVAVRALGQAPAHVLALSWSARDEAREPEDAAGARPGGPDEIWVDVSEAAHARIILAGGAEGPVVRIVDAPAAEGGDSWPAVCETVAQIVSATARALEEVPLSPVPAPGPPAALPEPLVGIRRPGSPPVTPGAPPSHRYGLALVAGEHTSPFQLGEPHDDPNWLGASVSLAVRRESRRALFEVRLTAERSLRSIDMLDLRTQYYSATLAASRAFTSASGELSASLGVELGAIVLRQATSPGDIASGASIATAVGYSPSERETTWSAGALVGLLGQARWTVRGPVFINVVCSVPAPLMNITENGLTAWHVSPYFRMLGGLGVHL